MMLRIGASCILKLQERIQKKRAVKEAKAAKKAARAAAAKSAAGCRLGRGEMIPAGFAWGTGSPAGSSILNLGRRDSTGCDPARCSHGLAAGSFASGQSEDR